MIDEEKNQVPVVGVVTDSSSEEIPARSQSAYKTGFLGRLRHYEDALDRKLGVEGHSIQRRLPDERNPFYAGWSGQLVSRTPWTIMIQGQLGRGED